MVRRAERDLPTYSTGLLLSAALAGLAITSVDAGKGMKCAVCTLLTGLLDQLHSPTQPPSGMNPDFFCQLIGMCDGTCQLFGGGIWPVTSPVFPTDGGVLDQRRALVHVANRLRGSQTSTASEEQLQASMDKPSYEKLISRAGKVLNFIRDMDETVEPGASGFHTMFSRITGFLARDQCNSFTNITCEIHRVFDDHLPLMDSDNDWHAGPAWLLSNGLRGGDWRGRDCDDKDSSVYPGRVAGSDLTKDTNCNGIYGQDDNGASYEEQFCSGDNAPMGVAILGDSAAAHFHIPPQYINARSFNLSGILELASNEADWPQCSWSTGFRNTAECPTSFGVPMGSIYQRMRDRNLCMHRDFQNIGVNGARSGSMSPPGIVESLARNQTTDRPALVFLALIGNDVCNGHVDQPNYMTTVEEFRTNTLNTLAYLDTVLPAGSHVAFLGLADGRILYDTTHNRTHPVGVKYPDVYNYLSCNGLNPCWGWLNSNATWRNFTTERAQNLTAVYSEIIASGQTYKNFDMYKLNVNWDNLINEYIKTGADPMNIIEPVDGFHPSQAGQQLLADMIWVDLTSNRPNWLPPVNPNNAAIAQIFGDQGGYD